MCIINIINLFSYPFVVAATCTRRLTYQMYSVNLFSSTRGQSLELKYVGCGQMSLNKRLKTKSKQTKSNKKERNKQAAIEKVKLKAMHVSRSLSRHQSNLKQQQTNTSHQLWHSKASKSTLKTMIQKHFFHQKNTGSMSPLLWFSYKLSLQENMFVEETSLIFLLCLWLLVYSSSLCDLSLHATKHAK